MDAEDTDLAVARIAAAIGEPARVRMLYCLHDNHARTATELAVIAEVSPSTASTHLNKLKEEQLIEMQVQGKHRYYRLKDSNVARALESLSVIAGHKYKQFVPNTPVALREARTCYDHIAGRVGVLLHNCLVKLHWISQGSEDNYDLTSHGEKALTTHGIDVEDARLLRRRFAYACIDWSERQPHLGGALAAAILKTALKRKWVTQQLDSRALEVTRSGKRELSARFGVEL